MILIYPRGIYCMIKIRSNRTCCCTSSCRFKYFCSKNSITLCSKYFCLFVSSRSHIYEQKLLSSYLLDFKKTCSISKFSDLVIYCGHFRAHTCYLSHQCMSFIELNCLPIQSYRNITCITTTIKFSCYWTIFYLIF